MLHGITYINMEPLEIKNITDFELAHVTKLELLHVKKTTQKVYCN
jgi:hypothetical protein